MPVMHQRRLRLETRILNYGQAAALLNAPLGTLYAWVSRGQIPHLRYGPRSVRFEEDALLAWIAERRVPAAQNARESGRQSGDPAKRSAIRSSGTDPARNAGSKPFVAWSEPRIESISR